MGVCLCGGGAIIGVGLLQIQTGGKRQIGKSKSSIFFLSCVHDLFCSLNNDQNIGDVLLLSVRVCVFPACVCFHQVPEALVHCSLE